uniref:Sodium channel and clathrin linker 1 n=1 Tax=Sphaeramia orbicularis TaxID=375764 RepID=A0A672ZXQ8_9TELE
MADVKVKLERVVSENERLHAELRESVERQLHAVPVVPGVEGGTLEEEAVVRNLQEQIQLSEQVSCFLYQCVMKVLFFPFSCCRQAKAELRTATAKVGEMTKLLQSEEDVAEAQGREDAADRRLQQLQSALSQLEVRLKTATQEAETVRREQAVWERKVSELQTCCTTLEEEKYEALAKVRESVQVAEEAALQKEQALLREKQKTEELERTREAIKQLIQDAAVRTRKEVDNVRKQFNVQIHRMAEELSAMQLECADKESQIERSHREIKALEEELEKVYKEGRAEPEFRKIDALHQRCLDAERMKEDISITLQSTQAKLKKTEMDYSEELSRCQEDVRRLQDSLAAARDDCVGVSDERLRLQQENLQLRREMDEMRKTSLLVQKKAKQQMSQLEQEYSLKEQGLDARVRELEESSRSSSADLTRLLTAQQKSTQRWKEEAKNLVQAFETKITSLKAELNRQKQRSHELEMQLDTDHGTIAEYERQLAEYQEKTNRLQRRLTQAEQRATSATQQLSMMASQQRKTPLTHPETV